MTPPIPKTRLTRAAEALMESQGQRLEDVPAQAREAALGNAEHDVEAVLDSLGVEYQ